MTEATRRNRLRHGLYTMQKAVTLLGSRALPAASTALGRELRAWRSALVSDLGGEDAITTQQAALIEVATTTRLLLSSIDGYILGQLGSPVNKRRKALHPVVRERQQLADALARYMGQLGLERRARDVPSLEQYIRQRQEERGPRGEPEGSAP